MNQTVTVKYNLSQAGQKAALLAGRPAAKTVTEQMDFTPAYLDVVTVTPDGNLVLDASVAYAPDYTYGADRTMYLDRAPYSLGELAERWQAHKHVIDCKLATEREEKARRAAEEERKRAEKAQRDFPLVEDALMIYDALDPLDDSWTIAGYRITDQYVFLETEVPPLLMTPEQQKSLSAIQQRRREARAAAKEAAAIAEKERLAGIEKEHGGYLWPAPGGMCDFAGYGLWATGQTKRWVGVFSKPKGVDRFCNNPRGEMVFDISLLKRGDCIQGGGYDTNSRGKRRHETEWFGVVVSNANNQIVVRIVDSRTEALALSAKMYEEKTAAYEAKVAQETAEHHAQLDAEEEARNADATQEVQ